MLIRGFQQPPWASARSWSVYQVSCVGPTPCILPVATRWRLYSRYLAFVTWPAPLKIDASWPNTFWPPFDSFMSIAHA